jgi:hypothetical protein
MTGNIEPKEDARTLKGKIAQIPIIDTTLSKSGYSADAKVTGDALKRKVNVSDIIDNLETANSEKPLSAKQGFLLKTQIDEIREIVNNLEVST